MVVFRRRHTQNITQKVNLLLTVQHVKTGHTFLHHFKNKGDEFFLPLLVTVDEIWISYADVESNKWFTNIHAVVLLSTLGSEFTELQIEVLRKG